MAIVDNTVSYYCDTLSSKCLKLNPWPWEEDLGRGLWWKEWWFQTHSYCYDIDFLFVLMSKKQCNVKTILSFQIGNITPLWQEKNKNKMHWFLVLLVSKIKKKKWNASKTFVFQKFGRSVTQRKLKQTFILITF